MTATSIKSQPITTSSYVVTAQRVLNNEANALLQLSASLAGPFDQAIQLLLKVKGRVIVSGMGKSGHVGRKIAATLASTGQPAYFVHPAEASHGDLGMITQDDMVVALSFSGETSELINILDYTKRFNIPLIAVTRADQSTLARYADVALFVPNIPEACPMGLAPTTSTTMMMALGDALAVALLEAREFSSTDFHIFHPGGSLGGRLRKVSDCMHRGDALPLVNETDLVSEALIEMSAKGFGCVGVLSIQQHLIGIITDGDLRRHMEPTLLQRSVTEIMTRNPSTLHEQSLMSEALACMNQKKITALFVVDQIKQTPMGIIHVHDCLRAGVA
jgi:arabinose-5-phosphate isomerase